MFAQYLSVTNSQKSKKDDKDVNYPYDILCSYVGTKLMHCCLEVHVTTVLHLQACL